MQGIAGIVPDMNNPTSGKSPGIMRFSKPDRPLPHHLSDSDFLLSDPGEVEIVRVPPGALSALWRGLMDTYHYLKSEPLCGAQLEILGSQRTLMVD